MTGRRTIAGLCTLCALLVSAFAAQSANAATKGTTGTAPAGTGYSGAIQAPGGEWFFHFLFGGVEVELKSTELSATGEMESMLAGTGEHTSNGTGVGQFKKVTVVKPFGKGCEVVGGAVTTNTLKATTAGQGMGLKFEPAAGGAFTTFEIAGCGPSEALKALNGTYEVTGSIIGVPTEGTNEIVFERTPTTSQATLKLRGQKAGLKGVLKVSTSGGEAIKASTVETP